MTWLTERLLDVIARCDGDRVFVACCVRFARLVLEVSHKRSQTNHATNIGKKCNIPPVEKYVYVPF